jgi:hypothetical protein
MAFLLQHALHCKEKKPPFAASQMKASQASFPPMERKTWEYDYREEEV